MKFIRFIFCFLLATFLCGFGCSSSKPTPDPLAGWQIDFGLTDQAIEKDSQDYLQKLPPEEKKNAGWGYYYTDGKGQHTPSK